MKLYIVIAFDPKDGPYAACSNTCEGEAACSATDHAIETGHRTRIIMVEI